MKKIGSFLLLVFICAFITACGASGRSEIRGYSDVPDRPERTVSWKDTDEETVTETPVPTATPTLEPTPTVSQMEVCFLDVGQGDSALIVCDGEAMLIDGGGSGASDVLYTVLKKRWITTLKYVIASHPDEDHIGGLAGALSFADAERAFCVTAEDESFAFETLARKLGKTKIEVPVAGARYDLGGAYFEVLAPEKGETRSGNTSLLVRLVHGENSFLFTGDDELSDEKAVMANVSDLRSDVLKAAHHGSDTSTSEEFLSAVSPSYVVISAGKDNMYGHPSGDVLARIKDAGIKCFRTDLQGDITFVSDGETLDVETARSAEDVFAVPTKAATPTPEPTATPVPTPTPKASSSGGSSSSSGGSSGGTVVNIDPGEGSGGGGTRGMPTATPTPAPERSGYSYVLNTNTHKFHIPSCSSVRRMSERNKEYSNDSRDEIIARGYSPCQRCHP